MFKTLRRDNGLLEIKTCRRAPTGKERERPAPLKSLALTKLSTCHMIEFHHLPGYSRKNITHGTARALEVHLLVRRVPSVQCSEASEP